MKKTYTFENVILVTNEKNYFAIVENNKTKSVKKPEFETRLAEENAKKAASEATKKTGAPDTPEAPKTERKPKGQRFDEHAKDVILAPLAKEYTTKSDSRGRISYKQDRDTIIMIQPAKTHYTVYVSKHLLATPDQVIAALEDTFDIEAKVNPTYIVNKGHDAFSVKATVTNTTPDQLDNLVDLLIVKNNEVAKA